MSCTQVRGSGMCVGKERWGRRRRQRLGLTSPLKIKSKLKYNWNGVTISNCCGSQDKPCTVHVSCRRR